MTVSLHYILSFSHEEYGKATSLQTITEKFRYKAPDYVPQPSVFHNQTGVNRKANATFVILARNSDLKSIIDSIKQNEDRFNRKFGYPYVFLNEEPFSEEFKRSVIRRLLAFSRFIHSQQVDFERHLHHRGIWGNPS